MPRTKQQAISDIIAAKIIRNKYRGFSAAHDAALREIYQMSTPTSETLNGGSTMVPTQTSDANKSGEGINLVEATRPRASAAPSNTSGMNTGVTQVGPISVKPVDRKTIAGSTPGDFRVSGDYAKGSVEVIKNAGGPRTQMGQQASSKFDGNAVPFSSSTAGSEGDRS